MIISYLEERKDLDFEVEFNGWVMSRECKLEILDFFSFLVKERMYNGVDIEFVFYYYKIIVFLFVVLWHFARHKDLLYFYLLFCDILWDIKVFYEFQFLFG